MRLWKPSLTVQILLALLAGALVGGLWPAAGQSLQILGTIFVRLVLVIIAPLIFSSLAVGVAGQGGLRKLGTIAVQTFVYAMAVTALALAIGFGLALVMRPGVGFAVSSGPAGELVAPPAESIWVRMFPQSIFDAMARGDVLQVVIFSLIFGMALTISGESGRAICDWCHALSQVMYRFTDLVMKAAPLGVFGAAAALVSREGLAVGASFLRLTVTVYAGLIVLVAVIYPLLALVFRVPVRRLYKAVREPFAIAFATCSASAALPKAMETMEEMGVPRSIVSFVLPIGLSLNSAGSALFVGAAALFIIQAFNVRMEQASLWALAGALYMGSKGISGVPRFGLIATAAGLSSAGVPSDVIGAGMGILLGIDPVLDMPRTAANITGNCLAAALVARWQGNLSPTGTSATGE